MIGGGLAFFASFGLMSLYVQHGTTKGTMRGGTAYYVPPGSTTEQPVKAWFHDSGRQNLRDGDHVAVMLYPSGGSATSKSPFLLAVYCVLGGLAAMGLGYVFIRF